MSDKKVYAKGMSESEYIGALRKKLYDRIEIVIPKEKQFPYRLTILSQSTGKSKNQIIIEAIEAYLEKEGL